VVKAKEKRTRKRKPDDQLLLTPEEESLLTSLLETLKDIDAARIEEQITDPRIAQALIERLPPEDPETPKMVVALRDAFRQKRVQKAIKKTLFRMRQKGIHIPEPEPAENLSPLKTEAEKPAPTAYLGPIDGAGSRALLMILPVDQTGLDVGMGVVNDEKGLVQFIFGYFGRKRTREIKAFFLEQYKNLVGVSIPHAATVLENAYRKNMLKQGEAFRDYLRLRPWILKNVALLQHPAIYDFIPAEIAAGEMLTEAQIDRLLAHELMDSWIIELEILGPVLEELVRVEKSPILLSDQQKLERIRGIKEEGIRSIYPDFRQALLKGRLEEMAYIFHVREEKDYARLALDAALSLGDAARGLRVPAFLWAMVERSLRFYMEAAGNTEDSETSNSIELSSGILLL
jgi:hypothetical protein